MVYKKGMLYKKKRCADQSRETCSEKGQCSAPQRPKCVSGFGQGGYLPVVGNW